MRNSSSILRRHPHTGPGICRTLSQTDVNGLSPSECRTLGIGPVKEGVEAGEESFKEKTEIRREDSDEPDL